MLRSTIDLVLVPHSRNGASGRVGRRRLSKHFGFYNLKCFFFVLRSTIDLVLVPHARNGASGRVGRRRL